MRLSHGVMECWSGVLKPNRIVRKRWAFVVAATIVAALITLACWPSQCPIELKSVSIEPAETIDDAGHLLCLLTLSIRNPNSTRLRFENLPMIFEERIANHWVEAPNRWTLGGLSPASTAQIVLLITPSADACRFRLKYCYLPGRLPLGIGDHWARVYPPTALSSRVQHIIQRLSANLYDHLWPKQPSPPFFLKPRWRVDWTRACSVSPPAFVGGQMRGSDTVATKIPPKAIH